MSALRATGRGFHLLELGEVKREKLGWHILWVFADRFRWLHCSSFFIHLSFNRGACAEFNRDEHLRRNTMKSDKFSFVRGHSSTFSRVSAIHVGQHLPPAPYRKGLPRTTYRGELP
jgi:hypothetical protein